jgi:hypothetical protein
MSEQQTEIDAIKAKMRIVRLAYQRLVDESDALRTCLNAKKRRPASLVNAREDVARSCRALISVLKN